MAVRIQIRDCPKSLCIISHPDSELVFFFYIPDCFCFNPDIFTVPPDCKNNFLFFQFFHLFDQFIFSLYCCIIDFLDIISCLYKMTGGILFHTVLTLNCICSKHHNTFCLQINTDWHPARYHQLLVHRTGIYLLFKIFLS